MARSPETKAKRLVFVPISLEDEKMSMDAKTLCIQDGITIRDFLSECIELGFKVHHWPPGNPQLTLETCQKRLAVEKCRCGRQATIFGVHVLSGKEVKFCSKCFSVVSQRHDSKIWRFSNSDSYTAKCISGRSKE